MSGVTLEAHLNSHANGKDPERVSVALLIRNMAAAACLLNKTIEDGLTAVQSLNSKTHNASGDAQHALDVHADQLFIEAAKKGGVAHYASEEQPSIMTFETGGNLAVAIDPLDGSSNVDINMTIGSIFSVLPALDDANASFLQPGRKQLAAGIFIYGPQLSLVLTLGKGTTIFTFSRQIGTFVETRAAAVVPEETDVFAINMSNYRHWDEPIRLYVDDCMSGADGVRGRNFNMRWVASMVADAYRLLIKGGIYLYPGDERKGYLQGRLRLVYEANPVAMLMEQAGGRATNGVEPILDLIPTDVHQHVPLVFGSANEVETVSRYIASPAAIGARHPLFGQRGLFRA